MGQWDKKTREIWRRGHRQDRKKVSRDKRLTSLLNSIPYTDLSTYGDIDGVTEERFYDALDMNADVSMS